MHVQLMNTETSKIDGETQITNMYLDPDDGFEGSFKPKRWLIHYLEPNVVTFRYESSDKFLNVIKHEMHSSGRVQLWENEQYEECHWILIPID